MSKIDIHTWLLERRDEAATKRNDLHSCIALRDDEVKSGRVSAEMHMEANKRDLLQAHEQDALSVRYFEAAEEIARGRRIMEHMAKALKERGQYAPKE